MPLTRKECLKMSILNLWCASVEYTLKHFDSDTSLEIVARVTDSAQDAIAELECLRDNTGPEEDMGGHANANEGNKIQQKL